LIGVEVQGIYMAPESEGDGELTEKIDVFSFGVVVLVHKQ
jgi:hypothetical protein